MTKDGGPAFPRHHACGYSKTDADSLVWARQASGMSMREWFSGLAMQGLLSNIPFVSHREFTPDDLAVIAHTMADAMLSQREKAVPAE